MSAHEADGDYQGPAQGGPAEVVVRCVVKLRSRSWRRLTWESCSCTRRSGNHSPDPARPRRTPHRYVARAAGCPTQPSMIPALDRSLRCSRGTATSQATRRHRQVRQTIPAMIFLIVRSRRLCRRASGPSAPRAYGHRRRPEWPGREIARTDQDGRGEIASPPARSSGMAGFALHQPEVRWANAPRSRFRHG